MVLVELAITLTVWFSFGAFIVFPIMGAPPEFARVAAGVCGSELIATLIWLTGRAECVEQQCSALTESARSVATVQLPAVTGGLIVLAVAYGLRCARSC
jgi:Na+/glutamate symporter